MEEIDINKKSAIEKEKRIGAIALELSEGNHELEDAKEELANAEKFKANMKEQCATMEKQRDERAKMRAAEIQAVSEAVGILNDDDALEVFKKQKAVPSLVQKPQTFDAFVQVQRSLAVVSKHAHANKEEPRGHNELLGAEGNALEQGDAAAKLV